jgi:hypothetical protein
VCNQHCRSDDMGAIGAWVGGRRQHARVALEPDDSGSPTAPSNRGSGVARLRLGRRRRKSPGVAAAARAPVGCEELQRSSPALVRVVAA